MPASQACLTYIHENKAYGSTTTRHLQRKRKQGNGYRQCIRKSSKRGTFQGCSIVQTRLAFLDSSLTMRAFFLYLLNALSAIENVLLGVFFGLALFSVCCSSTQGSVWVMVDASMFIFTVWIGDTSSLSCKTSLDTQIEKIQSRGTKRSNDLCVVHGYH